MEVSRPDREIRSARLPQIQLNKNIQNYTSEYKYEYCTDVHFEARLKALLYMKKSFCNLY